MKVFNFKILLFAIILLGTTPLFAAEHRNVSANSASTNSAKDVCADDYWKWCAAGEAPFDCFKRRGFFKKDSMLSMDCKKAWSRTKPSEEPVREREQVAEQPAPQKLKAEPKKQPASVPVEPTRELPKKDDKQPDPDDFSDLEFQ